VLFSTLVLAGAVILGGFFAAQQFSPALKTTREQVFQQWYSRTAEASKKATRLAKKAQELADGVRAPKPAGGAKTVAPSVIERIRGVGNILDTCQQDIYDEFWVGLETYPGIVRSYVPLINYYTDTAFPAGDKGSAVEQLHLALQYEVGHFDSAVQDFEVGIRKHSIRDVERAFADMSLAYDRYLKAGNLYAGYDPVTSTTVFYEGIPDSQLVYTPITLETPRIRDEVLVLQGPDKGKVGRVIWLGRNGPESKKDPNKVVTATVKLEPNPLLGQNGGRGVQEVKAYPYSWIAVTRTSQDNFVLDIILAGSAAIFSCGLTYPLDSLKARIQAGQPLLNENGIPGLFKGLEFNLFREAPNMAVYMATFNFLTRQFCLLPFVDANNPSLKLLVMIPAGVLGYLAGSPIRAPFELLNKQIQTGAATTNDEAIQNVFFKPSQEQVWRSVQTSWILCIVRGIPFGALQCTFYEIFKDRLELVQYGCPVSAQPFIWGALAGALTGVITNPPDVVLSEVSSAPSKDTPPPLSPAHASTSLLGAGSTEPASDNSDDVWAKITKATVDVYQRDGPGGFFLGAGARALYFAPEACLWFAAYEFLKDAAQIVSEI